MSSSGRYLHSRNWAIQESGLPTVIAASFGRRRMRQCTHARCSQSITTNGVQVQKCWTVGARNTQADLLAEPEQEIGAGAPMFYARRIIPAPPKGLRPTVPAGCPYVGSTGSFVLRSQCVVSCPNACPGPGARHHGVEVLASSRNHAPNRAGVEASGPFARAGCANPCVAHTAPPASREEPTHGP